MRSLLLIGVALASCSLGTDRATVAVPGANLTLAFEADEKHMIRYHFLLDGSRVSDEGFLGPHQGAAGTPVGVVTDQDLVRVTWGGHYIVIDVRACRVVEHSNSSVPPPELRRCNSNVVPAA
jgi:hypothetical protein